MYSQTPQYNGQTMPLAFPPQPPAGRRWAVFGAYVVGVLGLVAVAVTLAIFVSYKGSASAQLTRMRHQLTAMSQELQTARSANASSYDGLSGKVSGLSAIVSGLANYAMVCTQDLTGQNGPAELYFPCTDQKP
jgi:hypothetical protein